MMNDEELVEVIAEAWLVARFHSVSIAAATGILAALRSAGYAVYRPEDCEEVEVRDYRPNEVLPRFRIVSPRGHYFLVPADPSEQQG